jgi:hypothetical protein
VQKIVLVVSTLEENTGSALRFDDAAVCCFDFSQPAPISLFSSYQQLFYGLIIIYMYGTIIATSDGVLSV